MHEFRKPPRQVRSRLSIDAILDAAEQLIHERGQVSFTAAELAAGAGMSSGRLYYWFPDIPAVVSALADRGLQRLTELFERMLIFERHTPTPIMIRETLMAVCDYVDENPATVALCLVGSGADDYGIVLRDRLADITRKVVRERVPDVPADEVELVAEVAVGVMLGMLSTYMRATDTRPLVRQELIYVLSAWLYARYPSRNDAVWQRADMPIQPSRLPRSASNDPYPTWPALSPRQPL